jgi:hypothetical protein
MITGQQVSWPHESEYERRKMTAEELNIKYWLPKIKNNDEQ